jgi:glycosyltransferase involved in cell wall biosynthesis
MMAANEAGKDGAMGERRHTPETRDTWVVVPAYREAAVIRGTVAVLRSHFAHVVVVDDGSPDATGAEALAAGAVVVRHPVNLGQGASLQTGIEYALARDARYVATFDADGQHRVEDLLAMLGTLQREPLDIVLGSRFTGEARGLTVTRRLVLKAAVLFTNLTTGVRLTDARNGLRVMTAEAARRIELHQDDMAHASEFVSQVGRLGLRFREVPVTILYSDYSVHKGQRLSNSFRILSDLLSGWLQR